MWSNDPSKAADLTEAAFLAGMKKLLDSDAWIANYLERGLMAGMGKIVLFIHDQGGKSWVGERIFDSLDAPRTCDSGLTTTLHPEEEHFLIALAQNIGLWHPYDFALSGQTCKPWRIYESIWTWLEAGQPYFRFSFSPPLEVYWDEAPPVSEN